jgi:hypothetical protein
LTGAASLQNDGCMNDMLELISFGKVSASAGISISIARTGADPGAVAAC